MQQRQYPGNNEHSSGWVTTRVAAAALGVKPRQVRNYIAEGILEAKTEDEGVNRRYLVSIASVEVLRDERKTAGKMPGQDRDVADDGEMTGHSSAETAELMRELVAELTESRYQLGKTEARLELTAQAQSSLHEQLARERERADRAERRVEDLEQRLSFSSEAPTAPSEAQKDEDGTSEPAEHTDEPRAPWWKKLFGT
jgi:hypothetical protein